MISILDRYLFKKFIASLLFALIGMVTIFVAVNYVENADKFIDRKVPAEIIFQYYLNFIPHIVTLTLPVDILLACLFSIGDMARFNELTAVKASGRSLYRMLLPVIFGAAVVSAADFWISEAIVPTSNRTKAEIWKTYVDRAGSYKRIGSDLHLYDPRGVKVFIDRFDKKTLVISQISIQHFFGNRLTRRLDAPEANWDSASATWILKTATERIWQDTVEVVTKHRVFFAKDLFFTPDDILRREQSPEEMNYIALGDFIQKLRKGGARTERWEVDYQLKFAYPLTCFFMVLFGAPLAASRNKSGAGVNIFLTLVVCLSYWSLIQTGRFMGYNQSLTPHEAAWLGNTVFGVLGIGIFWRMKS